MCPTHILVHCTSPLRGSLLCLVRGIQLFSGGEYSPLRGGYINPCIMYERTVTAIFTKLVSRGCCGRIMPLTVWLSLWLYATSKVQTDESTLRWRGLCLAPCASYRLIVLLLLIACAFAIEFVLWVYRDASIVQCWHFQYTLDVN